MQMAADRVRLTNYRKPASCNVHRTEFEIVFNVEVSTVKGKFGLQYNTKATKVWATLSGVISLDSNDRSGGSKDALLSIRVPPGCGDSERLGAPSIACNSSDL